MIASTCTYFPITYRVLQKKHVKYKQLNVAYVTQLYELHVDDIYTVPSVSSEQYTHQSK